MSEGCGAENGGGAGGVRDVVPRPCPASPISRFAGAARDVLDLLRGIARPQVFPPGTCLWREGDSSGMLVALERGCVKIYRLLQTGDPITIFLFGPGEVFGFMPLLDGRPYPATAQALEPAHALVVQREALVTALKSDPRLAMALIGLLTRRLRESFDRIERGSVSEVLPRVAAALHSLVPPGPSRAPAIVHLPVPALELAALLGIAPESFSRAATKLVKSGVLHRLGPRRFQVLDPGALRSTAGAG